MAAGAVVSGITLEAVGRIRASARIAIATAAVFGIAMLVFALSQSYVLPRSFALFVAGAGNLITASTSQTIVQLEAPPERRRPVRGRGRA